MPSFRYSYPEDSVDRVARRAGRPNAAILGLLLVAVLRTMAEDLAPTAPWVFPSIFVAAILYALWQQRRPSAQIKSVLRSTVVELSEEELISGNPSVTRSIRKENVVELREFRDGILVRGGNLDSIGLSSELSEFEDLAERLRAWVPNGATRTHSSSSMHRSVALVSVINFILTSAAFLVEKPAVAIPFCVGELILMSFSAWWILRGFVEPKLKRRVVLLAVLLMLLLLHRGYVLWPRLQDAAL